MEKEKLTGKYIRIYHGSIFDRFLIFGKIEKVDELDNVHLRIDKLFHKTFFHRPRLFSWNPFFPIRKSEWYDYRGKDDDWNYHKGDIITFPLKVHDFRLTHEIELANPEDADKITQHINELYATTKGGWFGFP